MTTDTDDSVTSWNYQNFSPINCEYLAISGCQACSKGNAGMVRLLLKNGACVADRRGHILFAAMRIETLFKDHKCYIFL